MLLHHNIPTVEMGYYFTLYAIPSVYIFIITHQAISPLRDWLLRYWISYIYILHYIIIHVKSSQPFVDCNIPPY